MNFEKEWIRHFAKDISKNDLDLRIRGSGNFICHAFSWELIDKEAYLVGEEARKSFNYIMKNNAIFHFPWDEDTKL